MRNHNSRRSLLSVLVLVLVLSMTFCVPAFAAKPTTKNVKAKFVKVIYYDNMKTYFKIKFTNNSSKTIKSVKIVMSGEGDGAFDSTVKKTKTVKLNLKAKKSVTKKVYFCNMVDEPDDCKVKIKSISY